MRLLLSLTLLAALAVPHAVRAADPPSRRQLACVKVLHAGAATVAAARNATLLRCVAAAARNALPHGAGAQQCVDGDAFGLVAKAQARTVARARKRCTEVPAVGPTSADAVNAAFATLLPVPRVFGPDLGACLVRKTADRRVARCQGTVARGITKIAAARVAGFNACVARTIRRGELDADTDLVACLRGDAAAPAARAAERVARDIAKRCDGVDVATHFPGECAGESAATLGACIAPRVECDVCLAVGAADGVDERCTHYVDGIATPYCGTRPTETWSVARRWDEATLAAVRKDLARPPVQARNLFHTSVAMWDAWAAYDATADGVIVTEKATADDVAAARDTAISFAAYRVLRHRYANSPNADATHAMLDATMGALGYDVGYETTDAATPAALGNRIAAAVIAHGLEDGANETGNYADPSWQPCNPPLIVKEPGVVVPPATLADPNCWQQLALDLFVDQNGIVQPGGLQAYVGAGWKNVTPFALVRPGPGIPYGAFVGAPPRLGEPTAGLLKDAMMEVIRRSAEVDPTDPDGGGVARDFSPATIGNATPDQAALDALSPANDQGSGYGPTNPVTGEPFAPNVVKLGDYARTLAEFWADGPQSETPPGHWNSIANYAMDRGVVRRIGGSGPVLDPLAWDVRLYLALNGALHDAAIAAWELKRYYQGSRPITLIRYMGGNGPSVSADDDGLPLEPGLVEQVTSDTAQPGGRHEGFEVGTVVIRGWPGQPVDPATQVSGVHWVRAIEWRTYQRDTFVTPPFPGFVSGHSSYSRSAAEVLARLTGSPYFPGGFGEYVVPAGFLQFEEGPSTDVHLQWVTYFDAADQAGISRRWGGIHPYYDDYPGRRLGHVVGPQAWAKAQTYFDGTAR